MTAIKIKIRRFYVQVCRKQFKKVLLSKSMYTICYSTLVQDLVQNEPGPPVPKATDYRYTVLKQLLPIKITVASE